MFYQLILSVAVAGLVINLIALFIIGKKKHRTMFHDLLIILTFSDVAVVICCALQFALPSLWQAYSRQAYPYILQYLLPFMHITVMVSVYTTILIRYRTFFKDGPIPTSFSLFSPFPLYNYRCLDSNRGSLLS